ncbi:hypothetical protein [Clostridium saccharobutylicum]|uniref:Uncharacterized protein n=1 Tax=Clostridium saccharobutylicum DSM 13864 TaxID=1345695 RepID=U5MTW0_CLOSA|nr:hypothetical protein [Clostridium saccharobutylicum]AGX44025.1 hypothetical protein CLSA_c30590 [Clostridium saccharobutylicum DSM 13864]AQR91317.1 hypothetical protein CLOSC_30420 [Clostridium saccharobutylicum]AQS01221.1 hypothetical protein CSACC_30490 [Clostridium saccharobutylicum]AQS10830.1 hypothetical protein CLOBY_29790 [Clostridium saccharobutylicum]AQS15204.1 hypothetical protein CLOSACC_30490 [Clostridium saccharobutylicum]
MKSKNIAQSGILIALNLVILYSASILPISTLSILTVASCITPISIIRTSIKNAILIYLSSSILSFFLVSINIAIYYTLFFGIYGIIKYFIERFSNLLIELILKLLSFNVLLMIFYIIAKSFLSIPHKFPLWLLWISAQIIFLIYDYALTLLISFIIDKFHKYNF